MNQKLLKSYAISASFILILLAGTLFAAPQELRYNLLLKSGQVMTYENLDNFIGSTIPKSDVFHGEYFRYVQFYEIPTQAQKDLMTQSGMRLLHYMPNYAFLVAFPENYNRSQLTSFGIRSIVEIKPAYKLDMRLLPGNIPEHAMVGANQVDVIVNYFSHFNRDLIAAILSNDGYQVIRVDVQASAITVRINIDQINQLSAHNYIYFIEPIDPPAEPENKYNKSDHRSNSISTDYAAGRKYDGTGVNVALLDDGIIGPHIDYQGRIGAQFMTSNGGSHGDHVGGTIMSAGNLDPNGRGMASGSTLWVYNAAPSYQGFDSITSHNSLYNIVITSTSYSDGCNAGYTTRTQTMDRQLRTMPNLMHVFSAGNNGTSNCSYGAGSGWGNITGGHKMGKNVITVANLTYTDALNSSSSRGPAHDGRIKPDVSGVGTDVFSNLNPNTYTTLTGTSMSCPGVSGTLAQYYHAYKVKNGGNDPKAALMKAIMMNTADDIGNAGPDYKHGYGRINGLKAVKTIEQVRHQTDVISQGDTNTHTITVPANVRQLKVMLYWSDYEAAVSASKALVNDLNMWVTTPSATSFNPWVLNPAPNATTLDQPAIRSIDSLNNAEQVTINDPAAGNYTVKIRGYQVPQGPVNYFVTYDFVTDTLLVTYPMGGEGFVPGTTETIRWDSYGTTGTFTVEYSSDNGTTWNVLSSTVAAGVRHYDWVVPTIITSDARIRVTRGTFSGSTPEKFTIISRPTGISVSWACPDSVQLVWNPVSGAIGYEVYMLGQKYMDSKGTTNVTNKVVGGHNPVDEFWYSVSAIAPGNGVGRRANAVKKGAGVFGCVIPVDVALTKMVSPATGTFQSCQNLSAMTVKIELENKGAVPATNFPVFYKLNGGPTVTETYTGTIAPAAKVIHSFTPSLILTAGSSYNVVAWVELPNDGNNYNDTAFSRLEVVTGTAVALPWSEDFETFNTCSTVTDCELTTCPLLNGLINERSGLYDDIDWRTDNNGTPSANTGPAVDKKPGTTTGKYVYLEASACFTKRASLLTPCIDLTTAVKPYLSFWYHMYGATTGTIKVDVLANGIWTENVVPALSGNKGNFWFESMVNLTPFTGQIVTVRVSGTTGADFTSDMALDAFSAVDSFTIGIPNNNHGAGFTVYPNPANGKFNFKAFAMESNQVDVQVTDIQGRVVYQTKYRDVKPGFDEQIDLTGFTKGIYHLRVLTGERSYTMKLGIL